MSAFAPETSVLSRISGLLDEIKTTKEASVKKADDGTTLGHSGQGSKDPGGYQGPSTHPSAKVDSNTQSTPLGSRFKENSADMKDKHTVANVDSISEGGGGSQDSKQIQSGTVQSATGEQPSVEDHFKGTKDDKRQGERGGTSSPVNAEDTGEKYGSMKLPELTKLAYSLMDECLADIANGATLDKNASAVPAKPAAPAAAPSQPAVPALQQKTAADNSQAALAAQAGYELAGAVGQVVDPEMEKTAGINMLLEHFIKTALEDADLVGPYLHRYAAEKRADDMAGAPPMPPPGAGAPPGGDPMGGGGMPPGAGGPPGGDPMGGGGAPPGAGGPPPGGDPMGGGGPGGPGGGGGAPEDAINELAMALMELGIQPDQLIQAMQAGGGGAGGPGGGAPGGPGGGEGGEKSGAARLTPQDREALIKMANDVKAHQRSGKLRIKEATGQARVERDEIKNYLREVCR